MKTKRTKWLWIGRTAFNLDYIESIEVSSDKERVYLGWHAVGIWKTKTITGDEAAGIIKWLNESDEVYRIP